jgi:hypothetical protein
VHHIAIAAVVIATALSLQAQDWTPKRIVAITNYAPLASAARISGDIVIKCYLDGAGAVVKTEAVSGHPMLKEQARQNALLWKFQGTASSPNASDSITLTYQFRMEGETRDHKHTSLSVDLPNVIHIIAPEIPLNP